MLTLLLTLLVTGVALAVFFYVAAMFLQGYIYTEPSADLHWQAPATGGVLMVFLTLWCVLVANAEGASPRDIPYDTLFRFTPTVDLSKEPAPEIWAVKKDGTKTLYKRERTGQTMWRYVDASYTPSRPWRDDGVVAVSLVIDGENYVFNKSQAGDGANTEYVNDKGWTMKEYGDGPTGIPTMFRWGRFLLTLFLNFGFFLAWWLCLWLLLRFQWSHALGLGFVLWLIFTFAFLPMLLESSAKVAQEKATAAKQVADHSQVFIASRGQEA